MSLPYILLKSEFFKIFTIFATCDTINLCNTTQRSAMSDYKH